MLPTSTPDQVVSEVLEILLKHHPVRTEDGQSIDTETLKQFNPLQQLIFQEERITSAVDSFLNGLARHLPVLRRQRNQCLPIYRLPNEIFAHIFEILVEDRFSDQGTYDLIADVVQVSSRWRNIALSTARLWTHIESHYCEALVTTSISRSRNLPLHIFISDLRWEGQEGQFLQLMLPHMARWETCKWDSDKFWEHSSHLMMEDIQMPLLRKFEVVCYWEEASLLPNAIWQHAPLLQSLDVLPFQLPEGAPLFSRLRKIRFWASANSEGMSSERWYSLLASCPELEDIDAWSGPKILDKPLNPFQVSLPYLKRFRLGGFRGPMIGLLLSSILIKEDQLPYMEIYDVQPEEADTRLLEMIFPQSSLKGTLRDCVHKANVISASYPDGGYPFRIQAGTKSQQRLLLYQINPGSTRQAIDMWKTVVSPNALPRLKAINLSGSQLFQDDTLPTLSLCTSLERLSIQYPDPVGQTDNFRRITELLSRSDISSTGDNPSFVWPCPNLKYLAALIRGNDFSPMNRLIQTRYGSYQNNVARLDELKLSTEHLIPHSDAITQMTSFLNPLGTVVRIVKCTDFFIRDWYF